MAWKRIARRAAVSIAFGFIGGHGGGHVADALEGFLGITDEAADKLIDGAFTVGGSVAGAQLGGLLVMVAASQFPPEYPKVGDLWKNELTNEIRVWTGDAWQPVRYREA